MGYDREELQRYNESANLKEVLQGGKNKGEKTIKSEILAQDQYKQDIMDALLQIRRVIKPMQDDESGEFYLQEFVRMEDGTGRWKMVSNVTDDEWNKLTKDGILNEEGAKAVLGHLNGLSNNNVALSNMTDEEINDIGRESEYALTDKLTNKREEFGIEDTDDIEWIIATFIRPNVKAALKKSKNGAFLKKLLTETSLVGSLDEQEEDKNLLDKLR